MKPPRKLKTPTKRILIVSRHSSTRYSGGRYHAWILAEAIAAIGFDTVVWTNDTPLVQRDFVDYPAHDSITLHVDTEFRNRPAGRFDIVILVPHLGVDATLFSAAVRCSRTDHSILAFLDFEAPSWFNRQSGQKRAWYRTLAWRLASRHAHMIISSTRTGSKEARKYYSPLGGTRSFDFCYPAINSRVADEVKEATTETDRQDKVVCITRSDVTTGHKGVDVLVRVAKLLPRGFELVIIGRIDDSLKNSIIEVGKYHNIRLRVLSGLTDEDKFREIASSQATVFLSKFEGFGYPPVESIYIGTPCIALELPVLFEVSGDALVYVTSADSQDFEAALQSLASANPIRVDEADRNPIARKVSFDTFSEKILALMDCVQRREGRAPRRRLGVEAAALFIYGWLSRFAYKSARHTGIRSK